MAASSSTIATVLGMAGNIPAAKPARTVCPRFATIDLQPALGRAPRRRNPLLECSLMNVTTKQFLRDFAFTCGAALAVGGIVSAVAVTVILIFVRTGQ